MMKTVFSRLTGRESHPSIIFRQLSGCTSVSNNAFKSGGRVLVQSQNQLRIQSPVAAIRSLGGVRSAHDQRQKGDEELLGFLEEEIATEKKMQRTTSIPSKFEGFSVEMNTAELKLTKSVGNEQITIVTNVNHSVDAELDDNPNIKQGQGVKDPQEEMRSRPNFDVEIKRGNETLCFSCSFIQNVAEGEGPEEFNDIFAIDEVTMYDADGTEVDYSVSGEILDGYLYDLFMNLLEERGVNNEFVEKFSDLCTDYEHKLYVEMLVKLQKFLGK